MRVAAAVLGRAGITIRMMLVTTAILLMPLMRKQNASLVTASSRPAMVGPIMRPEFCMKPLKASALGRSCLSGTISEVKDWRIGVSKAITTPSSMAIAITCHTSTAPA
jgi:hypothetical protein